MTAPIYVGHRDHVFPNRVPRPLERWLSTMLYVWKHKDIEADWYGKVKKLANEMNVPLLAEIPSIPMKSISPKSK